MTYLFKFKVLAGLCLVSILFTSCSKEETVDAQLKVSDATAISKSDMLGHWELSGMIADVAVDLDDDNVSNNNLLEETNCFNTMSITFEADGTFITNNAQMTFESGSSNNEFTCSSDRMDGGDWEVRNDSLILTLEINASTYTHRKLINLETNKFSLDVTKIESDQYVNDPGDTRASSIRILELEYTKA